MRILLATWFDPRKGEERTVALGELCVDSPCATDQSASSATSLPQITCIADVHSRLRSTFKSLSGGYSISSSGLDTDFELQSDADFQMFGALVSSEGTNTASVQVTSRHLSRPTAFASSSSIFSSRIGFKDYSVGKKEEFSSLFKNDSLKSLAPLLKGEAERLKISDLEEALLHAGIDLTLWNRHSFKHEKTLEALFDNIKAGTVELYKEGKAVVQVRHYVRVKVRHRESGLILLKAHEYPHGKSEKHVNDIMKFRCSKHETPFLTALEGELISVRFGIKVLSFIIANLGVQRELGNSLWGNCLLVDESAEKETSAEEYDYSRILEFVRPVGFDLPRTEAHPSLSYPQTQVLEYIDTLEVIWSYSGVPSTGSFTTVDDGKGAVHLWQWEHEESMEFEQKEIAVEAEVRRSSEDYPYSIMSRLMGWKSERIRSEQLCKYLVTK